MASVQISIASEGLMDIRDRASTLRWWERINNLTAYVDLGNGIDEDGEPIFTSIPVVMEVCPTCSGNGSYVNPNIDRGGLSREDFEEDLDFAEDYFTGRFNIRCEHCQGANVIPYPTEKEHIDLVESILEGVYYDHAEQEGEMRMGA